MKKTDSATLVKALRILAVEIRSGDGIANEAISEAAERIDDLSAIAIEMLATMRHDTALPEGCPACAMSARRAALGVVSS